MHNHLMRAIFFILSLFVLTSAAMAENDQEISLKAQLKQLVVLRQAVLDAPTDDLRLEANGEFVLFLRDALNDPESFDLSFDTIPSIGDLRSGDNFFRMITWNLPFADQTNRYFCFIQYHDKKTKELKLVELKRGYRDLTGEYRKVFNEKDWYGALYYKIIPSKTRKSNKKRTYMLLGWDGKNEFSSLKVVDVMTITNRGVRFGADIFDYPHEKNIKRFILEYKADAAVSLKYDQKKKRIVFNKLVPIEPDLEEMYEFYIPILEFSAFEWKRRRWVYVEDVDVRAPSRDVDYNDPPADQNLD